MILLFIAGILLTILLIWIGKSRRPIQGQPESYPGWAGFLSIGLALLIGIAMLAHAVFGETGSLIVMILLPSICALLAESWVYLFAILASLFSRQVRHYLRWPAGLLLVIPFMAASLGFLGDPSIFQVALFGGILLASGWMLWNRLGRWLALSYAPLLFLSFLAIWATDTQSDFQFLPGNLASAARNLVWLAPGLGIIVSGRLLGWVLADEQGSRARRAILAGLLAAPILVQLAWQAATASAWDVATDGLGGVFMLELAFVLGAATAIHLSWGIPFKRYSFLCGYVLLILAIILGANSFGTYGFEGAWGNAPHARTSRRAEIIHQAILRYYEQKGHYPQSLADLTPGTLLYLPTPFIIPRQDWCYQGGQSFYRLGYVDRDYFSTPAAVKVFSAAGKSPDPAWPCDAEAAKYPAEGY